MSEKDALSVQIAHSAGLRAHEINTIKPISEREPDIRDGKTIPNEGGKNPRPKARPKFIELAYCLRVQILDIASRIKARRFAPSWNLETFGRKMN